MKRAILINDGKQVRLFVAIQGFVVENDNHQMKVSETKRGVFRAQAELSPRRTIVEVGKEVDPGTESKRLKNLSEKKKRARTGSPGVKGYQHMENMANAAISNSKKVNHDFSEILRKINT